MAERELVGWIVVDEEGWAISPWSYGKGTGDGKRTTELMSKMDAETMADE